MESATDRLYRRSLPQLWPRFAAWVVAAFAINWLHSHVRPRVLASISTSGLGDIYLRATSSLVLTVTFVGLSGLVVCYYFALRERQVHTALTELGLAIRSVLAALAALGAFVLAIHINSSGPV